LGGGKVGITICEPDGNTLGTWWEHIGNSVLFSPLDNPEKIPVWLLQRIFFWGWKKCAKVTRFLSVSPPPPPPSLKSPYLDNRFPESLPHIAGFSQNFYFPLWPVAKFD
jgi:hypothetical protein